MNPFDLKSFMPTNDPVLIITYAPYDVKLLAHGFHVIDSTRTMQTLLVVDFLCADRALIVQEQKRFKKLKAHIDRAIEVSQTDPKHYFDVVVPYLQEKDFRHFKEELSAIEWINHPTSIFLKKLQNTISRQEVLSHETDQNRTLFRYIASSFHHLLPRSDMVLL